MWTLHWLITYLLLPFPLLDEELIFLLLCYSLCALVCYFDVKHSNYTITTFAALSLVYQVASSGSSKCSGFGNNILINSFTLYKPVVAKISHVKGQASLIGCMTL